jgi:hypothetical protein
MDRKSDAKDIEDGNINIESNFWGVSLTYKRRMLQFRVIFT